MASHDGQEVDGKTDNVRERTPRRRTSTGDGHADPVPEDQVPEAGEEEEEDKNAKSSTFQLLQRAVAVANVKQHLDDTSKSLIDLAERYIHFADLNLQNVELKGANVIRMKELESSNSGRVVAGEGGKMILGELSGAAPAGRPQATLISSVENDYPKTPQINAGKVVAKSVEAVPSVIQPTGAAGEAVNASAANQKPPAAGAQTTSQLVVKRRKWPPVILTGPNLGHLEQAEALIDKALNEKKSRQFVEYARSVAKKYEGLVLPDEMMVMSLSSDNIRGPVSSTKPKKQTPFSDQELAVLRALFSSPLHTAVRKDDDTAVVEILRFLNGGSANATTSPQEGEGEAGCVKKTTTANSNAGAAISANLAASLVKKVLVLPDYQGRSILHLVCNTAAPTSRDTTVNPDPASTSAAGEPQAATTASTKIRRALLGLSVISGATNAGLPLMLESTSVKIRDEENKDSEGKKIPSENSGSPPGQQEDEDELTFGNKLWSSFRQDDGRVPLQLAAANGVGAEDLFSAEFDGKLDFTVVTRTRKNSLLHTAVLHERLSIVRQLLAKEEKYFPLSLLNSSNTDGNTALLIAITNAGSSSGGDGAAASRTGRGGDSIMSGLPEPGTKGELQNTTAASTTNVGIELALEICRSLVARGKALEDKERESNKNVVVPIAGDPRSGVTASSTSPAANTKNAILLNRLRRKQTLALLELCRTRRHGSAALLELAGLLADSGRLDHEVSSSERSALHFCAEVGNWEIMEVLLSHGANVNAQDAKGLTPLMIAVKSKDVEFCKRMLAACGIAFLDLQEIKQVRGPGQLTQRKLQTNALDEAAPGTKKSSSAPPALDLSLQDYEDKNLFIHLCAADMHEVLQALLSSEHDSTSASRFWELEVKQLDRGGYNGFHHAARKGCFGVWKILVANYSFLARYPSKQNKLPYFYAKERGFDNLCQWLEQAVQKFGATHEQLLAQFEHNEFQYRKKKLLAENKAFHGKYCVPAHNRPGALHISGSGSSSSGGGMKDVEKNALKATAPVSSSGGGGDPVVPAATSGVSFFVAETSTSPAIDQDQFMQEFAELDFVRPQSPGRVVVPPGGAGAPQQEGMQQRQQKGTKIVPESTENNHNRQQQLGAVASRITTRGGRGPPPGQQQQPVAAVAPPVSSSSGGLQQKKPRGRGRPVGSGARQKQANNMNQGIEQAGTMPIMNNPPDAAASAPAIPTGSDCRPDDRRAYAGAAAV
ncbi:unnamed protein product [Amoebophrya sp. A120]|nr:unnamed protein product [Amoebophrya sp. A120]|eukprot:GSA120T00020587001.1